MPFPTQSDFLGPIETDVLMREEADTEMYAGDSLEDEEAVTRASPEAYSHSGSEGESDAALSDSRTVPLPRPHLFAVSVKLNPFQQVALQEFKKRDLCEADMEGFASFNALHLEALRCLIPAGIVDREGIALTVPQLVAELKGYTAEMLTKIVDVASLSARLNKYEMAALHEFRGGDGRGFTITEIRRFKDFGQAHLDALRHLTGFGVSNISGALLELKELTLAEVKQIPVLITPDKIPSLTIYYTNSPKQALFPGYSLKSLLEVLNSLIHQAESSNQGPSLG